MGFSVCELDGKFFKTFHVGFEEIGIPHLRCKKGCFFNLIADIVKSTLM